MTLFQDIEKLYLDAKEWELDDQTTKDDMVRNCRSRVSSILACILTCPEVGCKFAHPQDLVWQHEDEPVAPTPKKIFHCVVDNLNDPEFKFDNE
eukprot:1931577-Rhodomonas_salina.7